MFTGLIQEVGLVVRLLNHGMDAEIEIACPSLRRQIAVGNSVAVDGVCLTANKMTSAGFLAGISNETLKRTTLRNMKGAEKVNLEPALAVGGRLGGHFVQGHVDAVGRLESSKTVGKGWEMDFSYPPELSPFLVEKGSVAVNGISLTIANIPSDIFTVAVIPHTFDSTNLKHMRTGAEVNLEVDILAKYVARILRLERNDSNVTLDYLREHGFDN